MAEKWSTVASCFNPMGHPAECEEERGIVGRTHRTPCPAGDAAEILIADVDRGAGQRGEAARPPQRVHTRSLG